MYGVFRFYAWAVGGGVAALLLVMLCSSVIDALRAWWCARGDPEAAVRQHREFVTRLVKRNRLQRAVACGEPEVYYESPRRGAASRARVAPGRATPAG